MPTRMSNTSEGSFLKTPKLNRREFSDFQFKTSNVVSQEKLLNAIDQDHDPLVLQSDEDENDAVRNKMCNLIGAEEGSPSKPTFDYQTYNDKRLMTPLQERWNGITMLPAMFYGFYFVLAGCWLSSEYIDAVRDNKGMQYLVKINMFDHRSMLDQGVGADAGIFSKCISNPWLPQLHALPPLPVFAGAVGVVVHAPFSFLYHWSYATKLHPSKRLEHWSRRLDHAFIHFASACMAYATSGRMDYFAFNAMYNLDCAYRQFDEKVRPRQNQIRIATSILLYILPVLCRGYYTEFAQLILIFTLGAWFFLAYPIGGWSHSMFHVVIAFLPHVIMVSACKLHCSQQQLAFAAQCALRAGK